MKQEELVLLDTRISIGDEVIAVNLTAGTTQVASVREFSGTVLTLETTIPIGIGDAVKVELEEGLLLGEVVYEHASLPNRQVIVRCYEWVGQGDLNAMLGKG
jgi:hypothetical protein